MTAQKNHRYSFPQQIARILAEEITERTLQPGERLLEQTLSERFGMSRAPIREALYLLSQEGLVERIPRKGALVKRYTTREIEELYKIRVTLEELALERDCGGLRMVRLTMAALRPIVSEMQKSRKETKRYHELNFEFHKALVEVSQSTVLLRLYAQIEGPLKTFLRLSMTKKEDVAKSIEDHKRIVAAIAESDAMEASKVLRAHEIDGMGRALNTLHEESSTVHE